MADETNKRKIIEAFLVSLYRSGGRRFVPAAVSNRHAHLCRADIDRLFGKGYELTPLKPLSQPDQYAAQETVTLVGPKGKISNIRVLGPARSETQVEISVTDSFRLGVRPAVRMSGETEGSPGLRLETEKGFSDLEKGVIISARHLHLSVEQAGALNLKDGQAVSVRTGGARGVVLENVIVRSGKGHDMEVHLDMDEANAALLKNGDILEVVL